MCAIRSSTPVAALPVPGVYVVARPARSETAPAPGSGIPAFVGFARRRQAGAVGGHAGHDAPVLRHWEQFDQMFEAAPAQAYLRHAVRGFFANGGECCVVLAVDVDSPLVPLAPLAQVAALVAPLQPGALAEDLDLVDLLCVPDLMLLAGRVPDDVLFDAQASVLAHCRRMGTRFAILDALPGDAVDPALRQWEALAPGLGALYFPWLDVAADAAPTVRIPPCGHVAGVFARTDRRAGPHQAPANELVHHVVRLGRDLSEADLSALDERGVNCLRSLPGRGIRVWGARTLSRDPAWRYVNVQRLFLALTRWAEVHCRDLVFDTNDARLWERLAQRLRGYCRRLQDQGALAGGSGADAFYVKCDAETNPRAGIEAGRVVAEVALAPTVPAEFVVVRLTQSAGGVAVGLSAGIA